MIIYKTTNLINGKFYIGQDSNNDPTYLGSGKRFKRAVKKYGRKNFKKEILEHCKTHEELDNRERYWIAETNAIKEGYNFATGGQGGNLGPLVAEKKSKSLKEYHKNNRDKYIGSKNPNADPTIYKFYNTRTQEIFCGTKIEMKEYIGAYSSSPLNALIVGRTRSYKGWVLESNKEEFPTQESLQDYRIASNNVNYNNTYVELYNEELDVTYKGAISGLRLQYGTHIKTAHLSMVVDGRRKSHRGWILKNN